MVLNFVSSFFLVFLWLIPVLVVGLAAYAGLSLPMRRAERTRFFLDIVEQGIKSGRTPEQAILEIANGRQASVGVYFHLLAARIETGLRFDDALRTVPRLVPAQIAAMLKVGAETGDLASMLPVCKTLLRDPVSTTRAATNYLLMFSLTMTLSTAAILRILAIFVIPKFRMLLADMEASVSPFCDWVMSNLGFMANLLLLMAAASYILLVAYVGGPPLARWLHWRQFPFVDYILDWLPWRRKRMLRSFGQTLSILLDANFPENRAVALAAGTSVNTIFEQRAERVSRALQRGEKLPDAIRYLDPAGELSWRMRNAGSIPRNFRASLSGWIETLEATAFRQQQATAQITTTMMVLIMGAFVGLVAVGIFQALIAILDEGILW